MSLSYGAEQLVQPLTEDSGRIAIHSRVAAPIASIVTIAYVDELKQDLSRFDGLTDPIRTAYLDMHTGFYNYDGFAERTAKNIINAVIKGKSNFKTKYADWDYLTDSQLLQLRSATHEKSPNGLAVEGVSAQCNATMHLFLPAFIAAQFSLHSGQEITDKICDNEALIHDTLQRPDFLRGLKRLPLTANGLYRDVSSRYVDSCHSVFKDDELESDLGITGPDSVDVYDIFTQKDRQIVVSEAMKRVLKFYLDVRNSSPNEKRMGGTPGPSRGCPVVHQSARLHETDLTVQQWEDLTGGENPIAVYNPDTQRLVYLRPVIEEVNDLLIDVFKP